MYSNNSGINIYQLESERKNALQPIYSLGNTSNLQVIPRQNEYIEVYPKTMRRNSNKKYQQTMRRNANKKNQQTMRRTISTSNRRQRKTPDSFYSFLS